MHLENAYENKEDIPNIVKDIDSEEKQFINKENEYIKSYCSNKVTAVKVSMIVLGIGLGVCFSILTGSFFNFDCINDLGTIGVLFGGILGYISGYFMDKYWTASRRLATYNGKITPNRIERLEKKLDKIRVMISETNEENLKQKLQISEKFLENRLNGKDQYSRFYEFLCP